MSRDGKIFTAIHVARSDLARAREVIHSSSDADRFRRLLDAQEETVFLQQAGLVDVRARQAQDHFQACPLQSFTLDELRRGRLTLDVPQEVPSAL